jgi:hypothetical protein
MVVFARKRSPISFISVMLDDLYARPIPRISAR